MEIPKPSLDRHWLLTWTTYGTWLPGDERGFVSSVRIPNGLQTIHNRPQTQFDRDIPELKNRSKSLLKHPPVQFTVQQAETILTQIQSTSQYRGWTVLAVAVMQNHVHVVIGVFGDPDPSTILRDLKSYGSRALNRRDSASQAKRWWTESGSVRKLADNAAVAAAVQYVEKQEYPLALFVPQGGRQV